MQSVPPEVTTYWHDELQALWYIFYALAGIGVSGVLVALTNIIAWFRCDCNEEYGSDTSIPFSSSFGKGQG